MNPLSAFFHMLAGIFSGTGERPSPSDIVPISSIRYDRDTGILQVDLNHLNIPLVERPRVIAPQIPNTNSMDPAYDWGHTVVYLKGATEADHALLLDWLAGQPPRHRGNIMVGGGPGTGYYVTHRVVKVGYDKQGRYWRLKGDNSAVADRKILRDADMLWVGAVIIY